MLGYWLWGLFILGVLGIIVAFIWDNGFKKWEIFFWASMIFIIIAIAGGINYTANKEREASPNKYYETLKLKQTITSGLQIYEKEIINVQNGNVEHIDFNNESEIIKINDQIKEYNYTILKHRNYKNSYWLSELYNEDIAKLETFELIFNIQKE